MFGSARVDRLVALRQHDSLPCAFATRPIQPSRWASMYCMSIVIERHLAGVPLAAGVGGGKRS